ncbi:hypothetical protein FSOLCH5_006361 [Fusarium solani]
MSSSRPLFKPCFNAAIELIQGWDAPFEFCHHISNDQDKTCSFLKTDSSKYTTSGTVSLIGPNFDLADVAAGLPELEAMLDALPYKGGDVIAEDFHHVELEVGIQGGIRNGAANILAKKMATLVMVLEESLLLKLVAPSRGRRIMHPVSKESNVVKGPWPQGGAVNSDYDSHVPPIAAMKPAAWNNRDPEHICRILSKVWSASQQELESILKMCVFNCDFYMVVKTPELPRNWAQLPTSDPVFTRPVDREQGRTWFCFRHLKTTFEYTLLRNWVEVIARIVELALAGPDEYKRCLEAIFRIQHDADQGGVTWEQLMTHVLKLEHRIQDWRDQLARYERGEIIAGLSEDGLLPKRMGPYYSQKEDNTALLARLRAKYPV